MTCHVVFFYLTVSSFAYILWSVLMRKFGKVEKPKIFLCHIYDDILIICIHHTRIIMTSHCNQNLFVHFTNLCRLNGNNLTVHGWMLFLFPKCTPKMYHDCALIVITSCDFTVILPVTQADIKYGLLKEKIKIKSIQKPKVWSVVLNLKLKLNYLIVKKEHCNLYA